MKNQIKLLLVLLSLFSLFCTSSKQVQKKEEVEVQKEQEEKKLDDPARSYDIVKQGVEKIYPELKGILTNISTIYTQRDTVSLKLYISSQGNIDLIGFVDKIELGSGADTLLDKFFGMQVIDTVHKTETVAKVILYSYLDANNAVVLSDKIDVDYVEIRSRDNILLAINFNKGILGKVYSRRWAEKRDLEGTITVRFGIDEHGNVVFCKVVKSTMNDQVMEKAVVDHVKSWKFGEIDNPGDVTEVVYPFNFTQ